MSDEGRRRPPRGYGEQPELHGGDQWGEPGASTPQSARARYPAPERSAARPEDQFEPDPQPAITRRRIEPAGASRRSPRAGRKTSVGYVDRHYGPPVVSPRRGSPKLIMAFAVIGLCLIGGLLYFVALGNDLPGAVDSTNAAADADVDVDVQDGQSLIDEDDEDGEDGGGAADGDENPPVSTDDATTDDPASDGVTDGGGTDGGDTAQPEDATTDEGDATEDGEDSPETTVATEDGSETTIALGLSSDINGVFDSDGIVLTGTAQNQEEIDRLVERLSVLSSSGSVDASAVVTDPASPPVRELALSVSDQTGFSVNSDVIEPDFAPILDRVVEFMQADQTISVAVLGHTDADGIDFENLALSQRRAEAVVAYLVEQGVNSFRLEPLGRGSTEPVATNDTAEGRALNRRIEFTILGLDI